MTYVQITRDIVTTINDRGETFTIPRGTRYSADASKEDIINNGLSVRVLGRRDDLWLFAGEDFEFEPIGGFDSVIPF